MELHMGNFILDPDGIIWLIDWSHAGGYPVFFEEAELMIGNGPLHFEFTMGLWKAISSGARTKELERLGRITYAVTTGRFIEPRESKFWQTRGDESSRGN